MKTKNRPVADLILAYRQDVERFAERLDTEQELRKRWLFDVPQNVALPTDLVMIRNEYALTDGLALLYQQRTHITLLGLFFLGFAGAAVFDLYAHLEPLQHWVTAVVFYALLGGAGGLYLWAQSREFQNRYLDYRALAEGLRILFYWRLVGIDDPVEDHYLGKHRGELEWIPQAIREIRQQANAGATAGPEFASVHQRLHWASEQWVKGQRDYFARAIKRDEWREQRTVWFKWGFVVVGLVLVFISLFVLHRLGLWGHGLLLVGAGLCPVAAALILGHAEKRALAPHIKQYDRMHHLFATEQPDLEKRLDDGDHDGARQLLHYIGCEALAENGDWVLLHRDRPIEVVYAG